MIVLYIDLVKINAFCFLGFSVSTFLLGSLVIFIGTILIVQFGGEIFNTRPLDFKEWCIIVASTSPIVIIREIWHRIFPKK